MAKKNATPPETPAQALAREYAELVAEKKELEAQIEAKKAEILAAYKADEDTEFGAVSVLESAPKPKLDFGNLTTSAQKRILETLKVELPDFVTTKTDLDLERIWAAQSTNPAIKNALAAKGLALYQEKGFTIRLNK